MSIELIPLAGDGRLVRHGGLVALTAGPPSDEVAAIVADVAGSGGDGRDLVRALAAAVLGWSTRSAVCAVGAVTTGEFATLAAGGAAVTSATRGRVVAGADPSGLAAHVLPAATAPLRAELAGAVTAGAAGEGVPLRTGTVRAGGFVICPATAPVLTPAAAAGTAGGVTCVRGHLNDPRTPYCSVCGLAAGAAIRPRRRAARPPLGVMLLDDGRQVPLIADVVVGAAPVPRSAAEAPVIVPGPGVGPSHLRLELRDWRVMASDLGAGITHHCVPGRSGWTVLRPWSSTVLAPGAVLAIGDRQLRFDSHRAQTGLHEGTRAA